MDLFPREGRVGSFRLFQTPNICNTQEKNNEASDLSSITSYRIRNVFYDERETEDGKKGIKLLIFWGGDSRKVRFFLCCREKFNIYKKKVRIRFGNINEKKGFFWKRGGDFSSRS